MTDTMRHSSAPLKVPKAVQFGVISPAQMLSMSVTQGDKDVEPGVTKPETYNYQTGEPVTGGLSDPRMGNLDDLEDPGYFGHIELARPVYHVGFVGMVLLVLRCVGYHNHKLLPVDRNSHAFIDAQRKKGKKRLIAMAKLCEGIRSDSDGRPQPKFKREGVALFVDFSDTPEARRRHKEMNDGEDGGEDLEEAMYYDTESGKLPLRAQQALQILSDLGDEECKLLGFNPEYAHPSWLIVKVLPVPPPQVRPSVSMGGARAEDDITYCLADIIKVNIAVKAEIERGSTQSVIDDNVKKLQFHVATFVDNSLPNMERAAQKSGKPLKTLRQRIVGKEGRVRGNIMGKRVDFTARSVITADPNLSIDQLGVPRSIALHMTVPERVTVFNKEKLRSLVRAGPDQYPGARYILKEGRRIDLRYNGGNEIPLREGDLVERHLANDDVVLFNRQPSLHKMSMMGHRVRVLPWSTFRLNLSVTTPYNADFDGDEMNMHVPQTILARAEAEELMMVNKVIVSPQSNRPVMGIVQDSLLASALMTKRDVFIGKEFLMNLLTWIDDFNGDIPIPAIMMPVPNRPGERILRWTGKQVFSLVIPNKINMNHTRSHGHKDGEKLSDLVPNDTWVIIEEGKILSGVMDKRTLGNTGGGLVHVVFNECGHEAARVLFNQIQKITNYWILQRSFTVGVGDTIAEKKVMDQVDDILLEGRKDVDELIRKGQNGELEKQPGKTVIETFEEYVDARLGAARDTAGKRAEASIASSNGFKGTVQAGSKGSFLNIAQIMACVGQQNVDGKRIPYGFNRRTLPHFSKDDLGPESRGFVEKSYLEGLTPQEFFFHAMGGRVGLIDTACKTAETGYIQRRLVKALEDISIRYDGTVRNGSGEIIQFLYGEDGMDAAFIETQYFDILTYNAAERKEKYKFDVDADDFGTYRDHNYLEYKVIDQIRKDSEARKILDEEFEQLERDAVELRKITYSREPAASRYSDKQLPLAVNIQRMILNAKNNWKMDETKPSDLRPDEVVIEVKKLFSRLVTVPGTDRLSMEAQKNSTVLFGIYLRSTMSAKQLLRDHRICRDAFHWLIHEIEARFYQSLVAPGEMCGVLAAQSIGEPATQMTLNTFHQAGVVNKNVTLGVPRLKEIINVATNVKTPSITIFLADGVRDDKEKAFEVLNRIEFTTLRHITSSVEIIYDPYPLDAMSVENGYYTTIEDDNDWVRANYEMYDEEENGPLQPENLLSFVLRIELNGTLFRFKKLSLKEIRNKIFRQFADKHIEVISSDDNDANPVIRLRLKKGQPAKKGANDEKMTTFSAGEEEERLMIMQNSLLDDMVLRGIPGITKVFLREGIVPQWNDEKGFSNSKGWVLDTEGTNLQAVLAVDGVDHRRTVSNDIDQTFKVLGIEGVRRAILNELRMVISFGGSYVNYRHLSLLVDIMTSRGYIMAITRHGINRVESGVLMRASFEETVEILMEAAAFSEKDPLGGVSENIVVGKLTPIGTGVCSLILDEDMLKNYAIEHVSTDDDEYMSGEHMGHDETSPLTPGPYTPGPGTPMHMGQDYSGQFSPGPSGSFSPMHSASPSFVPASPSYAPSSPAYAPSSPAYSPSSPAYSPSSPAYSPSSPAYSPSSPAYSPSSPAYSPSSPAYSPSSPAYSPSSPAYSPSSPAYSPSSPAYSPSSPAYSPSSPAYSPSSPAYSPSSPAYSPSSPAYSPSSPAYSPSSPAYSPSSPAYSPSSPSYSSKQ